MAIPSKAIELLRTTPLGVVSSGGADGHPQSAVVGLTWLDDRQELIIGTSVKSRKYANIKRGSTVSVALWQDKSTVQLEGSAEIFERGSSQFDEYQAEVVKIHPEKAKFASDPNQIWMAIRPDWIRFTNIATYPWEIEEATL